MSMKEQTESLCNMLLENRISIEQLIIFSTLAKESGKVICIEALEKATRINPAIADERCLMFATQALLENTPQVKWTAAKIIGNIVHQFPGKLSKTISNLIVNTEHTATAVRANTAFALGEIFKLKTHHNMDLQFIFQTIIHKEKRNSIKKIYVSALKENGTIQEPEHSYFKNFFNAVLLMHN